MSGLEAFGLVVLAILIYAVITMAWASIITAGDMDEVPWVAWVVGMLMFVAVIALWASGKPFPLGGGA